jgi:hypothetical protein
VSMKSVVEAFHLHMFVCKPYLQNLSCMLKDTTRAAVVVYVSIAYTYLYMFVVAMFTLSVCDL